MPTISLCMIVKNEEDVLGRCLDSVKDIADEIVIVDTGSNDKTKEIAKKYTDKIYDFEWIDDFSAARNYSFSKATKDYIMWMDADDVIMEKDRIKLKDLKNTLDPSVDVIMLKYDISFDEQGKALVSFFRERILKRSKNYKWLDPIHEVITPSGNVIREDISIAHKKIHRSDPKRNLRIYEKMLSEGKVFNARQQFYYSRELYYNERYDEAIEGFNKFIDSGKGWIEDVMSACKDLSLCYKTIGDEKNELRALLRSLEFEKPRAEICCDIGKYFFLKQKFHEAIFWYKIAADSELVGVTKGFRYNDCYGYIPFIQLCVCYDRIGDIEKAIYYNEKAGEIKPESNPYKYNKKYFAKIKNKQ